MGRLERWVAIAGGALVLLGLVPAGSAQELQVGGIYGGVWADALRTAVIQPFAAKQGVKVNAEEGISTVTLAKLRQQKGNPQFDVVWIDRVVSDSAIQEGLVERIDPAALSYGKDVVPQALVKTKSGDIVAVTSGYWAIGLAYNKKEIKEAPTSWLDMAKPQYKGKLAVYSPENAIGLPLLMTLAELNGGGPTNMDPGFAFVRGLAASGAIFFAGSPAGANLLASGEASIATLASTQTWDLQRKGHPIEYVVPKEGAIAGDIRAHIVKGAKNRALAEKLVNYSLSPEAQKGLVEKLLLAPVNTKTQVPAEVAAKLPWGPGGNASKLRLMDAELILANRDAWVARWNKEIAK
jgi:putative spermidine/putrescine transport system substrate-binding protein